MKSLQKNAQEKKLKPYVAQGSLPVSALNAKALFHPDVPESNLSKVGSFFHLKRYFRVLMFPLAFALLLGTQACMKDPPLENPSHPDSLLLNHPLTPPSSSFDEKTKGHHHPEGARALNQRGQELIQNKEYEPAFLLFSEAVRRYPDDPYAYANRARLLLVRNRDREALRDLSAAITRKANSPRFYLWRAYVYIKKSHYDLARADVMRAYALAPNLPDVFYLRGLIYKAQSIPLLALQDFDAAIARKNNHMSARRSRAFTLAALKRYDLALKETRFLLKNTEPDAELISLHGDLLAKNGLPLEKVHVFYKNALQVYGPHSSLVHGFENIFGAQDTK